jgi:hypothetical protein
MAASACHAAVQRSCSEVISDERRNGGSGGVACMDTRVAPRRGELGGNRTHDPRIKSALLYRLSYELISTQFPKYHNRKGLLTAAGTHAHCGVC